MAETKTCPQCGADLPADAPSGICPNCLMRAGFESEQDGGSASEMNPTTLTSGFVPPEPEDLAEFFPQLEILELLGKGGMGAVYKARQPELDRLVAVKILPPEIGADPAFAERFTREARALAKLSHQSIVHVYDFGRSDEFFYFIMEYVDGTDLRHVIETGAIKPAEALAIVPQICEALQFAHDEGIVHRDIKPENILVDKQGRVKIADFGLAKLLGKGPAEYTLTGTHQAMGTMHYMAPEQMQGAGSVDHRADIFSLGVVFYELLTGQLPIGRFEPPSKNVQIDVRLDEVVLRSLESEPDRRYQQVGELQTDVESISHDPPSGACPGVGTSDAIEQRIEQNDESVRQLLAGPVAALTLVAVAGLALGINGTVDTIQQTIRQSAEGTADAGDYYLPTLTLCLAIILLVDAIKMSRCEQYDSAVGGSIAAIVLAVMLAVSTHFALLAAAAAGIWAFVVLSRPEVKAAFGRQRTEQQHARNTRADDDETQHDVAARRRVQGPADALIVVGSIALLTAIGVTLWLWLASGASVVQSMTISTLQMMSVAHVVHAVFMTTAGLLMRRLRARLLVLLSTCIAGIVFPVVTVVNVIMEFKNIPVWPVIIPMWVGMPIAAWATVVLFRRDVREAFERIR
ncbi:MAG: hypothetical protein CMJ48_04715 [Planctomycetaceae bacterium]|nr:hypothetical protein [Planctomycetaceae bacterium]